MRTFGYALSYASSLLVLRTGNHLTNQTSCVFLKSLPLHCLEQSWNSQHNGDDNNLQDHFCLVCCERQNSSLIIAMLKPKYFLSQQTNHSSLLFQTNHSCLLFLFVAIVAIKIKMAYTPRHQHASSRFRNINVAMVFWSVFFCALPQPLLTC
jgi:hypothetical protein